MRPRFATLTSYRRARCNTFLLLRDCATPCLLPYSAVNQTFVLDCLCVVACGLSLAKMKEPPWAIIFLTIVFSRSISNIIADFGGI